MCGITGWIDWERDVSQQRPILDSMVKTLEKRGPDDSGVWLSTHAILGHRRLTVVDPLNGRQPMIRQRGDQTFVLVYNGELYNTEDLRKDLLAKGYTFQGHSDTEVLLVSYIEWGPACVERLNGIFAFAIWDDENQSLFLARDRVGVKPFFYTQLGRGIVFGSELKTVLAHPEIQPKINAEGLAEVLIMGPARTPGHGVFCGINELRPGYYLIFDRNGIHQKQYWKLESKPHTDDFPATIAKVRFLLQDAIERQLVSDVPLCTLLSGGLDSSAITAFAANVYQREGTPQLHTFSIDYTDNDKHFQANDFQPNADAPWVKRMSEAFNTHHHYITVDTPELVEALKPALYARDLPGMADIDSSLVLFSEEIKKHATVGLSGECADEIFGGYPWFHREDALKAETFPWSLRTKERAKLLSEDLRTTINPQEYVAQRYREALDEVPRLAGETAQDQRIREIFYLSITRFMPTLLDRKDRMTMAAGLEVRVPFCDHRLLEYVWNVPWSMKNCDNMAKGIVRRALADVLPADVLARRKSPYPKTHNPNYMRAVSILFQETVLNNPNSPLRPLINLPLLTTMATSPQSAPGLPWFGQLMGNPQMLAFLVQVDTWLRDYHIQLV